MNVIISHLQAPVVLKAKPYHKEFKIFLENNKRGYIIQQKCSDSNNSLLSVLLHILFYIHIRQ